MGRVGIEIPETSGLLCLNLGLSWTWTRFQTHSRLGMVTKKKKNFENKKNKSTTENPSNFSKEYIIYLIFNYKHNYTSSQ